MSGGLKNNGGDRHARLDHPIDGMLEGAGLHTRQDSKYAGYSCHLSRKLFSSWPRLFAINGPMHKSLNRSLGLANCNSLTVARLGVTKLVSLNSSSKILISP